MTRRGRAQLGLVLCVASASMLLVSCGSQVAPSQAPSQHAFGEALDPGPKPAAGVCEERLRSEQAAAARIRTELRADEVSSDPAAIKAAAADPAADLSMLGIPLTAAETQALRRSGLAMDAATPLAYWVSVGAPSRFGGIWIDPPGSNRFVVAVVGGDPDTLGLARCVEGPDVRYVWAAVSLTDGEAIKDRIGADIGAWRARGVAVNSVDFDETNGVVTVGVTEVNDALVQQFQAMYGPVVRLKVEGPAVMT